MSGDLKVSRGEFQQSTHKWCNFQVMVAIDMVMRRGRASGFSRI